MREISDIDALIGGRDAYAVSLLGQGGVQSEGVQVSEAVRG
jgi:hypothetical protein